MAFVRETKRINSYLIFLTLTIAGAPFLGLLGTVWGVMTTFAALALAGEANLAAIAPGMASALATTVAGLIIAIPALFGYNFLVMKVKDITADMSVFIDRFVQRSEEMR
jgi:biopolymer transport protein ExbB